MKGNTDFKKGDRCPGCHKRRTKCTYVLEGEPGLDSSDVYRLVCADCGKQLDWLTLSNQDKNVGSVCPFCGRSASEHPSEQLQIIKIFSS